MAIVEFWGRYDFKRKNGAVPAFGYLLLADISQSVQNKDSFTFG